MSDPSEQNQDETQVTIDRAELNRLQAAARVAEKERKDRERQAAADQARREREEADSQALRAQLAERDRRDTLRDEIAARGLTPSQSKLVLRLADLADPGFNAPSAVDAIVADYADVFAPTTPTPPPPAPSFEQPGMRRAGPAPTSTQKGVPFPGFISPEEYGTFPQAVRLDPKFRERVEASRPYWPKTFRASDFPQSN